MLDFVTALKQVWRDEAKNLNRFGKLVYGVPADSILSYHSASSWHFTKMTHANCVEVERGNFAIVLEAIRQQLTQGVGVVCLFWNLNAPCCSSKNKALLEKVWGYTKPDGGCPYWERLGCLNQ